MSDPLRVAFVGEGPTDREIIWAALSSMLNGRSFILSQLQPEESLAFGELGTGWVGVYKWCRQCVARSGGSLGKDVLYSAYDILILQLDADVAEKKYSDGRIQEVLDDLPCDEECPPPHASTNPLRNVLLRWAGENTVPPKTVLCTPSKSLEAWVVAALFPNDLAVIRGIECWRNPENRLGQQPADQRVQKRIRDYQQRAEEFKNAWPRLVTNLTEAQRFQNEFLAAMPP